MLDKQRTVRIQVRCNQQGLQSKISFYTKELTVAQEKNNKASSMCVCVLTTRKRVEQKVKLFVYLCADETSKQRSLL